MVEACLFNSKNLCSFLPWLLTDRACLLMKDGLSEMMADAAVSSLPELLLGWPRE